MTTPRVIGDDERRARLARRHRLVPTTNTRTTNTRTTNTGATNTRTTNTRATNTGVADVATALCGLHATDPASVYLSAWARLPSLTLADVDGAWYDRCEVVKTLGMRRTVFVVARDDLPVVQAACTDAIERRERAALAKLVEQSGVAKDGRKWLAAAEREVVVALGTRGSATGQELTKAVPRLATKVMVNEGTAYGGEIGLSTRVLFLLGCSGAIVRTRPKGSWVSSQHRWALTEATLGGPIAALDTSDAQAQLAQRWIAAFGPATTNDLQWWTGWTVTDTRRALAAIGAHAVALADGRAAWVAAGDDAPEPPLDAPWVALLPSLDPTAMGWTERDWYLGPHRAALFDRSGNIGPTVWCDGRIVGGWAVRADGRVVHRLLEDVGRDAARRIVARATALTDWLDGTAVRPRMPTPIDRELRALDD